MLRAALQVGIDAGRLEARRQLRDRCVDVALAALPARVQELRELAEANGLDDLEREILELPLDLPDPQPLGERRVDLEGLARDPELLLRRQRGDRPHVVEAIGELDEDDADVVRHRQEHLPDVLGLLLLVAEGRELGQLGHAVDELRDLRPEPLLDVGQRVLGVLRDVVEELGLDRDRVHAEVGKDLGGGDRVRDERLAGGSFRVPVRLDREVDRSLDRRDVGVWIVAQDRRDHRLTERGGRILARPGRAGRPGGGLRFHDGAVRDCAIHGGAIGLRSGSGWRRAVGPVGRSAPRSLPRWARGRDALGGPLGPRVRGHHRSKV